MARQDTTKKNTNSTLRVVVISIMITPGKDTAKECYLLNILTTTKPHMC